MHILVAGFNHDILFNMLLYYFSYNIFFLFLVVGFPTDSEPNLSYGTFPGPGGVEEQIDLKACRTLCHVLTRSLNTAAPVLRGDRPHRLVARNELVARIATDVVRMSQNEPLGTAGCLVRINLEGGAGGGNCGVSQGMTGDPARGNGVDNGISEKISLPPLTGFIAEVRCVDERGKTSANAALAPTCQVILSLREDDKRYKLFNKVNA